MWRFFLSMAMFIGMFSFFVAGFFFLQPYPKKHLIMIIPNEPIDIMEKGLSWDLLGEPEEVIGVFIYWWSDPSELSTTHFILRGNNVVRFKDLNLARGKVYHFTIIKFKRGKTRTGESDVLGEIDVSTILPGTSEVGKEKI